jgi:hypothetical protein
MRVWAIAILITICIYCLYRFWYEPQMPPSLGIYLNHAVPND